MDTTEFPYGAPTLAGTDRYSNPFTGLYTMLLLVNGTYDVNTCAFDVPPPGAGVNTVRLPFPGNRFELPGIVAVSVVPDTYVVVKGLPLYDTTEDDVKPVPFSVTFVSAAIAPAPGETEVSVGTGGLLMLTVTAFEVDVTAVGEYTVTLAVPAVPSKAAGSCAYR
jgi:hypothetical protein